MDCVHESLRDHRRHRMRASAPDRESEAPSGLIAPWHSAAAGEFWAITVGPVTVVARSDGDTFHVVQDSATHSIAADAALITAAQRLWPRDARKAE